MYEIDLLKLSEFFKNEIIVEQRKKIKELEEKLDDEQQHKVRLIMALENDCKSREELEKENERLKEEKQGLIKDWEEKKNLAYEIACKNEKLKETLAEIKEIVCLELAYGTNEEYANFYMQQREAILQKINESEGDNEV